MADPVLYERDGYVARITLNRPERQNAIDDDLLFALDRALVSAEEDIDARVVVIRGAGSDFSIGEDLSPGAKVSEVLPPDIEKIGMQRLGELCYKKKKRWQYLFGFPRPTIAQVHGRCTNLAMSIAMLCDFVFAADDAAFADRSALMGIVPSLPLWPFLVNEMVAKELLYSGRAVSGVEAEAMGLITKALPAAQLEAEVNRYIRGLLHAPADGLAWTKESLTGILEAWGVTNAWLTVEEKQIQSAYAMRDRLKSALADRSAASPGKALASWDQALARAGLS